MKTIVYKEGWKQALKDLWLEEKMLNLDLSGVGERGMKKYLERRGGEKSVQDFFGVFAFRGMIDVHHKGLCHTRAVVWDPPEHWDEWGNTSNTMNNLNKTYDAIEKIMQTSVAVVMVVLGYETQDLETQVDRTQVAIVKEGFDQITQVEILASGYW